MANEMYPTDVVPVIHSIEDVALEGPTPTVPTDGTRASDDPADDYDAAFEGAAGAVVLADEQREELWKLLVGAWGEPPVKEVAA